MPPAVVDSITGRILADGQGAHVLAVDFDEAAGFRNVNIPDALAGGQR